MVGIVTIMKGDDYTLEFADSAAMLSHELDEALDSSGHTWLPQSDRHAAVCVSCGDWMSSQRLCWAERRIVQDLRRRQKLSGINIGTTCPATLSADQFTAVRGALGHPVSVLRGGPGTGKTYTVGQIVRALSRRIHVEIVAPTGMAARRESEASGMRVRTIHSALKWDGTRFDPRGVIDCDILVCAESSMVSTYLTACLLSRTSRNARVLFVGDPDQLPSVEPGQVLLDLTKIIPTFSLTHCHRFDTTIHDWAIAIMGGIAPPYSNGTMIDCVNSYYLRAQDGSRILTYRNIDIKSLNNLAHKMGLPQYVVCLKNDRQRSILNGMLGISNNDGTILWEDGHVTDKDIYYGLAYATTIHKSQGSSIKYPIIYLPSAIDQCLLYTAVTRTSKKCLIYATDEAISESVNIPRAERFGLLIPYWNGLVDIPDPTLIVQR